MLVICIVLEQLLHPRIDLLRPIWVTSWSADSKTEVVILREADQPVIRSGGLFIFLDIRQH